MARLIFDVRRNGGHSGAKEPAPPPNRSRDRASRLVAVSRCAGIPRVLPAGMRARRSRMDIAGAPAPPVRFSHPARRSGTGGFIAEQPRGGALHGRAPARSGHRTLQVSVTGAADRDSADAPAVARAAAQAGFSLLFTSEPSSAARRVFGLELRGRFTIQHRTRASTVAGLASGDWLPCMRQTVGWSVKKAAKRLDGERYLALRKLLLRHGDESRWGESSPDLAPGAARFDLAREAGSRSRVGHAERAH